MGERIVRNPDYYLQGGDVVFRVEHNLFRVHRYFFTRDSAYFREKLPHPPPPGEFTKGSSDNNPFVLEDALIVDFERLLWVFYNPKYSIYEGDVDQWSSILHLAHKWEFVEVLAFSLRELEELEMPALQKIILYHTHDISRNLLQSAYTALVVRDDPISIAEGWQLGLETALLFARAREIARAPSKRSGNTHSHISLPNHELDALVRDLFHLSLPEGSVQRPATPQTHTGRGTPTGRNTPKLDIPTNGTGSPNSHRGATNGVNGHANGTTNGRSGRK